MAGLWNPKRVLLPSLFTNDPGTITWDNEKEGRGWRQFNGGGCSVYTHAAGLPGLVLDYASRVLCNLSKITSSPEGAQQFIKNNAKLGSMDHMTMLEPPILLEEAVAARLQFGVDVVKLVVDALHDIHNIDRESLTDGEFLGGLQLNGRNYKKNCAICLTEDIMGTKCTCGHTEIVVFRPCGHSLCVDPCFEQLVKKTHHLRMNKRTTIETSDGQKFSYKKHDVESMSGFPCPLCRGLVKSCFRAEDTRFTDSTVHNLLQSYAKEFSFKAIPEQYLADARQMVEEEGTKSAAASQRFAEEREAERQQVKPLVKNLVQESLAETKEQTSTRTNYKYAGRWHWGLLERVTQKGIRDGWSSYHFLQKIHTSESLKRMYGDNAAWSCCGAAPDAEGCQPCPHLGYRCVCGDGIPKLIRSSGSSNDKGSDPTLSLTNQDIAEIYANALGSASIISASGRPSRGSKVTKALAKYWTRSR